MCRENLIRECSRIRSGTHVTVFPLTGKSGFSEVRRKIRGLTYLMSESDEFIWTVFCYMCMSQFINYWEYFCMKPEVVLISLWISASVVTKPQSLVIGTIRYMTRLRPSGTILLYILNSHGLFCWIRECTVSWYAWTLIFYFDFLFFLSIFLDLIFLFLFLLDDEEAHDHGHIMHHMMWCHRSGMK